MCGRDQEIYVIRRYMWSGVKGSRDDLFEIGSDVTVVCNLTIGPHASQSANQLDSYYLTYLSYELIEPYEPMCVGSQSSHISSTF